MWKIEREGVYFKIYDKRKNLVGYFAPEYGNIYPEDRANEVIDQTHRQHDKIKSGYLMIPMVKFGIFQEGNEMNVAYLAKQLDNVKTRLTYWDDFLSNNNIKQYKIMVSHTDHDMLSITMDLVFSSPTDLEKNALENEIGKILDPLAALGLL
ncbi:MAG: hypothetical protein KGH89_05425 [Thaumarchaeota archaeon]|nr:hypothetical protein [Nitrososphaerota archaeon]MDE1868242.1 hypothetical protein [Nitrososphaerota archaeon]